MSIEKFKSEFERLAESRFGVRVVWLGSIARGEWRRGKDVDVAVFGRLDGRRKSELVGLLLEVANRHGIDLSSSPCPHPPVFFVDSKPRLRLYQQITSKDSNLRRAIRHVMKRIAPPLRLVARLPAI